MAHLVPYQPDLSAARITAHHFREQIDDLRTVPDRALRYSGQVDLMSLALVVREYGAQLIEEFYNWVKTDASYKYASISEADFNETWAPIQQIVEEARSNRDKQREAIQRIQSNWKDCQIGAVFPGTMATSTLVLLGRLSAAVPKFERAAELINSELYKRLQVSKRGIRASKDVQASDITNARTNAGKQPVTVTAEMAASMGLGFSRFGVLLPLQRLTAPGQLMFVEPAQASTSFELPIRSQPASPTTPRAQLASAMSPSAFISGSPMRESPSRSRAGSPQQQRQQESSPVASRTRSALARSSTMATRGDGNPLGSPEPTPSLAGDAPLNRTPGSAMTTYQPLITGKKAAPRPAINAAAESVMISIEDENVDEDKEVAVARELIRSGQRQCCNFLSTDVKTKLASTTRLSEPDSIELLVQYLEQAMQHPACYYHAQMMASRLGLMTKGQTAMQLQSRLLEIRNNRHRLEELKSSDRTYTWWRKASRPLRASDLLGPYRFANKAVTNLVIDDTYAQQRLWSYFLNGNQIQQAWLRDGTIIVNDIFQWWKSSGIYDNILEEMSMYLHHQREINGKPNLGWLRTQVYSLGQQLMRMDPVYYLLYVACRPDHNPQLVSYPYYCKYTQPGDSTAFKHIDINIPQFLQTNRGGNMIQGSLSLDDEDSQDCTLMLPGMHKHMRDWWSRLERRKLSTGGFVHKIEEKHFTREDATDFHTDWTATPCKAMGVRVSLPQLPHGSTGPATKVRRTMLPWFVALQSNLTSLEVEEGGDYQMLANCHRELIAPARTPSGLANMYGKIPYAFPAAISMYGCSALSDALVCQKRWDAPDVIRERNIMLCNTSGTQHEILQRRKQYIQQYRNTAVTRFKQAWALVQQVEEETFGNKSYFKLKREGKLNNRPAPDEPEMDQRTLKEMELRLGRGA